MWHLPTYTATTMFLEDCFYSRTIIWPLFYYESLLFSSSKSVFLDIRSVLQLRCMNVTEKFELTKKPSLNIAKYKIRHLETQSLYIEEHI